ncbi:MAG: hypothetical protein KGQ66_15815 [Acidobacteriota bacterium]|nr:hypothetical protein [Acidobacteriota bacterium]
MADPKLLVAGGGTADLEAIAAEAGFTQESGRGDWSGRPYFESVGRHVSV